MSTAPGTDWRTEFGIEGRSPPALFTRREEITPSTPQAHLLKRAFDTLEIDGVLCVDHSPLAYFKIVEHVTLEDVTDLHQRFWNHGGAALLVLVTDKHVHVYSGMMRPKAVAGNQIDPPSLVTKLERVAGGLQEFIVSVESGEFFHAHQRSFDPDQRVDRDLLDNLRDTREELYSATSPCIPADVLDALLCRLVFTCYLFDRGVIGERYLASLDIHGASDLRGILGLPERDQAKDALYRLFEKLREDFNGDLFSDDLTLEKNAIRDVHVETLHDFFQGKQVRTGQGAFWPYDFKFIPIETISAIYERFLTDAEKKQGAFYTPRFLAEVVLDTALDGIQSLIGEKFLDPACGSGIFLVGLFNRLAEEWKQANPTARNDRAATELMRLLQESLFGVDVSMTACRVTAFSLYLAYLDQLSPRDIEILRHKGKALPRLVAQGKNGGPGEGNIRCTDFFSSTDPIPKGMSIVIGNPPWGSIANEESLAGKWCAEHDRPLPDKQIAAAFVWKATQHITEDGRVCLVLPHGVLFNHSPKANLFQKAWIRTHAIDRVLNLADFQRFLFEKAGHPSIVVRYRGHAPANKAHRIEYWGPKADWTVTKAEVITIAPQDRTTLTVGAVLQDLDGPDAPQLWKHKFWATPRDWRLLDRLGMYPRLRDCVRRAKEKDSNKPWIMAVGFQPQGENDDPKKAETISLPSRLFIPANSEKLDLFLLERDCSELSAAEITVRNGSNKITDIYYGPHVLMAKGITSTAFADFSVSFQDAVRGIRGPSQDRELLVFLAAYLRSPLALYFLFHTSSNWGISRQEIHVEEVLRLPFPLPDQQPDPKRSWQIIQEVAKIVDAGAHEADTDFVDRIGIVQATSNKIEPLIDEYFDVLPLEKLLIDDTVRIIIPSTRPTRTRPLVPTVMPATRAIRQAYLDRLCGMLNGWAKSRPYAVRGQVKGAETLGVGIAVIEKVERSQVTEPMPSVSSDLLQLLDKVRNAIPRKHATLDIVRGVMVFERARLYVVKPIGRRFWSQTAAMNDADEIAATILMSSVGESL
ncbi:N-6 DNA methylase [Azospirillum sp. YIM B02556]|uniref:site-specific DNA-methyltransferase (adenine-specific) n=1 Tax=Azospirillum endophyticum TaxID=2800326 RepID=A0ABS1FF77_9PROT|nr:N-6 DNA methylase [Azospirillum endophyticum]MBK1842054.1 N-6 DNA methylase [Azospirillum endophyticum]